MIEHLVIGASGKTGRHVVAGLLARGATVRAGSRRPDALPEGPATPVRFEWTDATTWPDAVVGAEGVYLIKPETPDAVQLIADFLDVAAKADVKRLILASECAAQTRSDHLPERQAEILIECSGFEWTILRPSWMMQDLTDAHFFGDLIRDHRIMSMTTGGSATAWIDAQDIGEVAAQILTHGGFGGRALDLTGPKALTLDELATGISAHAGGPITPVEESIEDAEARMRQDGADEEFIAYITRISTSIVIGDTATVTTSVADVIGRDPRSIDDFLSEHRSLLVKAEDPTDLSDGDALETVRANEDLFRRQIDAWSKSDFDGLLSCYVEDMEYIDMPFADSPVRGKTAFQEHMTAYNAMFEGGLIEVEYVSLTASTTHVVGELRTRATYIGPGAPAGGVPVTWHATLVDTVRDGLVTSEHAYFDPTAFEKAVRAAG